LTQKPAVLGTVPLIYTVLKRIQKNQDLVNRSPKKNRFFIDFFALK